MNKDTLLEEVRKVELAVNLAERHDGIDTSLADDVWHLIDCINKLDKPQKPVIPKFVADCIEEERENIIDWHTEIPERFFLILGHKLNYTTLASTNFSDWIFSGNEEKLYRALKYGYEVEKEPVYYAKIKGHELVETKTILDDDTGDDISEFYRNIYFVLQRDGELIIDMKDNGLSGAKNVMTLSQWNSLGINETNADFEEVTK